MFIFAHGPLQSQEEAVVGIAGVVDAVLVCQDGSANRTYLQKMMLILVVAGHAAHRDPQDDADMIHGNFGQEAMKSGSPLGGSASDPLVIDDEQDSVPGPPQGLCMVYQGVLPFARFDVVEDLLRVRLSNLDDC